MLLDQGWIGPGNLRPGFQNCSGFKFLTLNQSWVVQRVQVREAVKHGSNLQLLEIEHFFFLFDAYILGSLENLPSHHSILWNRSSKTSVPFFWSFFKLCTSNFVNFYGSGSFFAAVRHGGRRKPPASTSSGRWDAEGEDWAVEPARRGEEVKQEWLGVEEVKSWGRWGSYQRTLFVGPEKKVTGKVIFGCLPVPQICCISLSGPQWCACM